MNSGSVKYTLPFPFEILSLSSHFFLQKKRFFSFFFFCWSYTNYRVNFDLSRKRSSNKNIQKRGQVYISQARLMNFVHLRMEMGIGDRLRILRLKKIVESCLNYRLHFCGRTENVFEIISSNSLLFPLGFMHFIWVGYFVKFLTF